MYKIGELSKLCRIPVRTLRYYDEIGLLIPDRTDNFTGYRYYSAEKIQQCMKILALKELGFTLDEIKEYISSESAVDLIGSIDRKCDELNSLIVQTESQIKRLENIRSSLEKGESDMYNVLFRSSSPIRSVFTRRIFNNKDEALDELKKLRAALPSNIVGSRDILINYESEYKNIGFDIAVCVEITEKVPAGLNIEEKMISFETETAVVVCREEELEGAYNALIERLNELDCSPVGGFFEIRHPGGTVELTLPIRKSEVYTPCAKMPFVNDPEVIGHWKMLDIVSSADCFTYGHEKCSHLAWLDEIFFLREGGGYWAVDSWTKGIIYTSDEFSPEPLPQKYLICDYNGHTLLFLEMKRTERKGNRLFIHPAEIWVYEKTDSKEYNADEIKRRDMTDYPFVPDPSVIGKWVVRDFYPWKFEENFNPSKQNYKDDDLFVREIVFCEDGTYTRITQRHTSFLRWTSTGESRGLILNHALETASAYEIRVVNGSEYLIAEWKTGDYQYGSDGRIYHYVFVRG